MFVPYTLLFLFRRATITFGYGHMKLENYERVLYIIGNIDTDTSTAAMWCLRSIFAFDTETYTCCVTHKNKRIRPGYRRETVETLVKLGVYCVVINPPVICEELRHFVDAGGYIKLLYN